MKLFSIPQTKLIERAKLSLGEKKQKPIILELLIFLLVILVAQIPQTVWTALYTAFRLLFDSELAEYVYNGNYADTSIFIYSPMLTDLFPSWFFIPTLICSGFMIVAAVSYCRVFENRKADTLGFTKHSVLGEYALGVLIGLVMISLPVLTCVAMGNITLTFSADINPIMILLFLAAFLLQGMGEEALFRGYLMTTLACRGSIWRAILLNSLLFSLMHIGNASFNPLAFLNIFLFGVFASILMLKRGNIWIAGAIHSLWNFAQGNIFGFNVSGNPKFDTIFEATQKDGFALLHGGAFGPEGGLIVTVLLLLTTLIALLIPAKDAADEGAVHISGAHRSEGNI